MSRLYLVKTYGDHHVVLRTINRREAITCHLTTPNTYWGVLTARGFNSGVYKRKEMAWVNVTRVML